MRVARIVIPPVVVVSPLLAISFKGDQEWWMYVLSQTGGNLGSIVASTISDIRRFIDLATSAHSADSLWLSKTESCSTRLLLLAFHRT